MPSDIEQFREKLNKIIKNLNEKQSDILAKRIAASFTLGYRTTKARPGLSEHQKNAIRELTVVNMGYISEFNDALGKQLQGHLQEIIKVGGGYDDVKRNMKPYIEEVFSDSGVVTIDRRGQIRTVVEVGQDGSLGRVEKPITKPYSISINAYSDMLGRTVAHAAYERGRVEGYKAQGIKKLRVIGALDERTRPAHAAVVGKVFEIGSQEEENIQTLLSEPNCRHRTIPFFDNKTLDTPDVVFEKRKKEAGLVFRDGAWGFKE